MPPEVLIYLNTVKKFLKSNQDANDYFLKNVDEEIFYKYLAEISQKNFEANGVAHLDVNQFELLKKTAAALTISKKSEKELNYNPLFVDVKNFGSFCLN
jgi:hypothetical protein